jgi:hypothetical protein
MATAKEGKGDILHVPFSSNMESTMSRHVLFAALALLVMTSSVLADAGPPPLGRPDFERSSSAATALLGVSLAAMLSFRGYWVIRNPWAGLASFFLGAGIVALLLGVLCLLVQYFLLVSPLFFGGGALLAFFGGKWMIASRAPFVGRNLVFLLLALGAAVVTAVALDQLTWTNPREEQRSRRERQRRKAHEREANEKESK